MTEFYAPFWLFDAQVEGHAGYESRGSRNTPAYSVAIDGDADIEKMPADASSELDDDYMDAIEPFDYSEMADFNRSRLAGYTAMRQDVGVEECKERIVRRVEKLFQAKFAKISGYSPYGGGESAFFFTHFNSCDAKLVLFPVWILNAKHNDNDYRFMMNGQTGKLVGRLPPDNGKVWKFRALFTGLYTALFVPILSFLSTICAVSPIADARTLAVLLTIALPGAAWIALGKKYITIYTLLCYLFISLFVYERYYIYLTYEPPRARIIIVSLIAAAVGGFWLIGKWLYTMDTVRGHKNDLDYVPNGFATNVVRTPNRGLF